MIIYIYICMYMMTYTYVYMIIYIYMHMYMMICNIQSVCIIPVCSVVTAGPSGITEDPGAQLLGHLWMKFGQGLFSPSIVVT